MKYLMCTGVVLALLGAVWTGQAQAECKVLSSDPTYTAGQLKDLTCNTSGQLQVEVVSGAAGGLGIANAAAPTFAEAAVGYFSWDLAGNLRMTLGTLLSGEDQTNNLLMTSGGVVRLTTFSSVTSATSSSVTTVPTGMKTFVAQIINATSETKAATLIIYGNVINSTTGGVPVCEITLPSTATTLQLQDRCSNVEENYLYWFYTVSVYTSASAAPVTVYALY